MKQNIMLTVLVVVGFGCQASPQVRDAWSLSNEPVVDDAAGQDKGLDGETDMPVVGFTQEGAVVVFDGRTGVIKSAAAGGGGIPRDVAMDPWRQGVWVYEENEDGSGGEIRFCPLEKSFVAANESVLTNLLPCVHRAWVDGNAALLPTADGLWVFEHGIGGARWKVLFANQSMPSVSAPRPASIWVENGVIEALTYGFQNDRLQWHQARMTSSGPEVFADLDWGLAQGYPPTARYAWWTHDAGLLFDAVSNALMVRRIAGGEMGLPITIDVGIPVPRIEAATTVGHSALVLGKNALWIVEAHDTEISLLSGFWLPGDVRTSDLFFSRDMLVVPTRAFVGTDRGVCAIALENDGETVVNAFRDEEFVGEALRGPLDTIRPPG